MEVLVTRDDLLKISNKLDNKDWKRLGRELGLEESKLDDLKHEYEKEGYEEVRFQMLRAWQQKAGPGATKKHLRNTFQLIGRNDLIEYLSPDNLKDIYHCLRKEYKALLLPKDVFLKRKELPIADFYVNPIFQEKHLLGNAKGSSNLHLNEIFKELDDRQAKRILIEGDTGYGKTTLITKLANDWSNGKEYLRHFSMVFIIFLRGLEQNFKEYLHELFAKKIKIPNLAREKIDETLKLEESRMLLLLDGYEELGEIGKKEILPLLTGELYPEMTVLMTSKPEEFFDQGNICSGQNSDIFMEEGIKIESDDLLKVWDKRIHLKGIEEKEREKFLEIYLQQNVKSIRKKFPYLFNDEVKELFHCPLYLFHMAVVIEDQDAAQHHKMNKIIILRIIIGNAIRRNLLKNRCINESNGIKNVLDPNNGLNFILEKYRLLLTEFGRFVFIKLNKGQICFSEKELFDSCSDVESILKMGFLIKGTKYMKHERHVIYQPVHESIFHFLGAFTIPSIISKIQKGQRYSNIEIEFLIKHVNFLPNQNSFLFWSMLEIAPSIFLMIENLGLFPVSFLWKQFHQPLKQFFKFILYSVFILFFLGIFAAIFWRTLHIEVQDEQQRTQIKFIIFIFIFITGIHLFVQILFIFYFRMFFYDLDLFLKLKERFFSFFPTYILIRK